MVICMVSVCVCAFVYIRAQLTCVVAQALSLLPPPVQPNAEAHEDDPAGPSDAGNEGWLLDHVCDLLRDAVVLAPRHNHVPEVLT